MIKMDNKEKNKLNVERLIDAIGNVEEKFIEEATPTIRRKTVNVFQIASVAAVFAVMIIGGAVLLNTNRGKEEGKENITVTRAPIMATLPADDDKETSEFESVDELLEYLGKNEEHPKVDGPLDYRIEIGETVGMVVNEDGGIHEGYRYVVKDRKVNIVDLNNKDGEATAVMDIDANRCIVADGKLIVLTWISLEDVSSNEVSLEKRKEAQEVRVYDLSNQVEPKLEYEYVQNGSYATSYVVEGKFYLLTGDGECSCGYSGGDKEKYKPGLSVEGKEIKWTDEDMYILGTPSLLQYALMTEIDIANGEMTNKKTFYGNIKKTHIGTDWIAIETYNYSDRKSKIYTFDMSRNAEYIGAIDGDKIKSILKWEWDIDVSEYHSSFLRYDSMRKIGGEYQIVSELSYWEKEDSECKTLILALTMQESGNVSIRMVSPKDKILTFVCDILWDENRAICTVDGRTDGDEELDYTSFAIVDFDKSEIYVHNEEIDEVRGIKGVVWYGSPLGKLKTIIPMGNGIYLRYNNMANGLDIYDLSDSSKTKCIYDSPEREEDDFRYSFDWKKIENDVITVKVMKPDDWGKYYDCTYEWHVYRVSVGESNPYELLDVSVCN